jgi:lipopolysaccharide export system protein LptA
MALGADEVLESSKIWTNGAGSVKTTDTSTLKVGESTIQGREFTIDNGEKYVTFNTKRHATMKKEATPENKDGALESSSDQTHATFENGTNMLMELVQTGNFKFRTPQYEGRADTGRFEDGGNVVTLEGSPVVTDSEKRLEAAKIRVNQKDNSFVATKNVTTLMKSSPEPVLVKAAQAESLADSMLYTGNVQLWRGDVFIKAEKLSAVAGKDREKSKVHAEGSSKAQVQSNLQNVRTSSDTLDYDDAAGTVHYLGHVHAKKQDIVIDTPDMLVHFRDNNVTDILADGGVVVDRGDQHGVGDRATYDAATDVVTLTGKDAQVRDIEHGITHGQKLTIINKGKNALVEADKDQRTTIKHPIKK